MMQGTVIGKIFSKKGVNFLAVGVNAAGTEIEAVEWPFNVHKGNLLNLPASGLQDLGHAVDIGELKTILKTIIQRTAILHHRVSQQSVNANPRKFLPYAGRVYDETEIINLMDAGLDFWLTEGPYTQRFERDLAKYLGVSSALFVSSGSAANLLAFMALTSPLLGERRICRGDEVITVAACFPTTVAPIIQYGAIPTFIDIDPVYYNLDVKLLEGALSRRTKAVMVAHTLGNPFDLQSVSDFCKRHNLWLIEDNCDALGSRYFMQDRWCLTGTVGDIGTSSFYPPHHMTTGEGGAVYTSNPLLLKILKSMRAWGRDCWCASGKDNTCGKRFQWKLGKLPKGYDHKYIFSHFGYNLKATDLQAAIGCAQLQKLDSFGQARRRNWNLLYDQLEDLSNSLQLPKPTPNSDPSWFGFLMATRKGSPFSRNEIVRHLEQEGIQTRMLFVGNMLRHPCFQTMEGGGRDYRVYGGLTNTDSAMNRSFWVGVYPGLSDLEISRAAETIRRFVLRNRVKSRSRSYPRYQQPNLSS